MDTLSAMETNMLLGEAQLKMIGATLYHIDRGGDITYHGPGQLVCYPMMPLWSYGFMQSKERYKSQDEVVSVVKKYRELGIPLVCMTRMQGLAWRRFSFKMTV